MLRSVQNEINSINKKIDEKIIRGLSYSTEARRHKTLLKQFSELSKEASSGIFSRLGFLTAIF